MWFANPGWRGSPNRAALDGGGGGGGYTGPGDLIPGAFAWWGFRAYNNAYISGVKHLVDLADASNLNPITIDCTATGVFDIAAYNTWATAHSVTAGTALVTKLYDQIGTNHFAQGTSANMPTFNPTGVTSMSVANSFSGKFMNTGNITLAQPLTASAIVNRVTTTSVNAAYFENGNTGDTLGFDANATTPHLGSSSGFTSSNAVALNTTCAVQQMLKSGAGAAIVFLDGTATTGTGGPLAMSAAPFYVLSGAIDVIKFTEGGLWSGDQSGTSNANFIALNTNQHAAYGGF